MPPSRRKQKGASRPIPKASPVPIRSQPAPGGSTNSANLTPTPNTTTTDGNTTYVSEGPTLPIIGVGAATVTGLLGATNNADESERGAKRRRRTEDADGASQGGAETTLIAPKQKQLRPPAAGLQAPLYKPWTLLPTVPRAHLTSRFGGGPSLEENIVPVVFTKNQNIRSGVNKIRTHLLESKEKVLAISAQGEGTIKMVGILEMVKRVAGQAADGDGEVCEWYTYTMLSSIAVEKKDGAGQIDDVDDEENAFEPVGVVKETEQRKKSERTVPVLSVWMFRAPIPQFRSAFGEEKIRVVGEPPKEER